MDFADHILDRQNTCDEQDDILVKLDPMILWPSILTLEIFFLMQGGMIQFYALTIDAHTLYTRQHQHDNIKTKLLKIAKMLNQTLEPQN
jgi:hypothetical protein